MIEDNRFRDNGDGTVTDGRTGLMWKQNDSMIDLKKWVNFQDSVDYARGLNLQKFAGYDDWRLPTRDEMETLYDPALEQNDRFDKVVHISSAFSKGCGFSMIAQLVPGRFRTWVLNLREGNMEQPDGLWTLSESARVVRGLSSGPLNHEGAGQ